jgi:predicted DNA-binding protein (MmcQ/YjbR family)
MAKSSPTRRAEAALRRVALAMPEAYEDRPWGEPVFKVRKKIFVTLGRDEEGLWISAKLPATSGIALMLPNVEPTGYNLGRSGWVTARFAPGDEPPMKMLAAWLDESYRAVAPKKLIARLDARPGPPREASRRRRGA